MSIDPATLPDGWCLARLADICNVAVGFAFKSAEFSTSGIRLLRGENIEPGSLRWTNVRFWPVEKVEGFEALLLTEGDVILAMDRPVISSGLKLARVRPDDVPSLLVQRVARLRAQPSTTNSFVYYALQSQEFISHLLAGQTGTQLPHVSSSAIGRYPVRLPPLPEQRSIVSKIEELFSDLDAGVSALERAKANLKRYRASVLKAAVEGRLTADWRAANPDVEPATELLHRILTTRRQTWEANQLAEYERQGKKPPAGWQEKYKEPNTVDAAKLPKLSGGWTWACVDQVGKVQLGRQRAPKHHNGPNMRPYLRVANVFENRIDISDVMEMNFTPDEYDTYKLEYGDILLNEGQSFELIGRPAMYRDEVPGACFTNTLVRFRAAGELDRDFAFRVFLAYLKNGRFQKIASITVNIAHLGAGRFAELEFPLPPLEEQRKIVEVIDHHFSLIDASTRIMNASLRRAKRLRQSILKRAFEGKLLTNYSITKTEAIAK